MKPEWGTKHECANCSAHFYDMRKPDAACPKCGHPVNDQAALEAKLSQDAPPAPEPEKDIMDDFDDIDTEFDTTQDPEEFLEDADDLGGNDESDMSEVMDHVEPQAAEQNV